MGEEGKKRKRKKRCVEDGKITGKIRIKEMGKEWIKKWKEEGNKAKKWERKEGNGKEK